MKSDGQLAVMNMSDAWSKPSGYGPSMAEVHRRVTERQAWEAQNNIDPLCDCHRQTLAAAWRAALREDGEISDRREREAKLLGAREGAPDALRKLGAPLDAVDALKAPRDTQAMVAARKFAADPSARFLVLLGSKGVGKTAAAVHCLREAIAKERTAVRPSGSEARTFSAAQFIRAATFARLSAYGEADKLWYSELCGCSTLVLDDFGAEELGTIARSLLDEMLDTRHASRRRTVITSNLGKAEFKARMGERLMDRIASSAVVAVCVGDSLRRRTP